MVTLASKQENDEKRQQVLPTLLQQHIFFASFIIGTLNFRTSGTLDTKEASPTDFANMVLSRITIFYDCLCIPQKPRSEEEQSKFASTLQHLHPHGLIPSSIVVALRSPRDGFMDRAWCLFKLSREIFGLLILQDCVNLQELLAHALHCNKEDWEIKAREMLVQEVNNGNIQAEK